MWHVTTCIMLSPLDLTSLLLAYKKYQLESKFQIRLNLSENYNTHVKLPCVFCSTLLLLKKKRLQIFYKKLHKILWFFNFSCDFEQKALNSFIILLLATKRRVTCTKYSQIRFVDKYKQLHYKRNFPVSPRLTRFL